MLEKCQVLKKNWVESSSECSFKTWKNLARKSSEKRAFTSFFLNQVMDWLNVELKKASVSALAVKSWVINFSTVYLIYDIIFYLKLSLYYLLSFIHTRFLNFCFRRTGGRLGLKPNWVKIMAISDWFVCTNVIKYRYHCRLLK